LFATCVQVGRWGFCNMWTGGHLDKWVSEHVGCLQHVGMWVGKHVGCFQKLGRWACGLFETGGQVGRWAVGQVGS
jgi:hypothetical protein